MGVKLNDTDRSVTLEFSVDDPRVKHGLKKIGKSLTEWKKNLEKGRKRARAYIAEQRRKRG